MSVGGQNPTISSNQQQFPKSASLFPQGYPLHDNPGHRYPSPPFSNASFRHLLEFWLGLSKEENWILFGITKSSLLKDIKGLQLQGLRFPHYSLPSQHSTQGRLEVWFEKLGQYANLQRGHVMFGGTMAPRGSGPFPANGLQKNDSEMVLKTMKDIATAWMRREQAIAIMKGNDDNSDIGYKDEDEDEEDAGELPMTLEEVIFKQRVLEACAEKNTQEKKDKERQRKQEEMAARAAELQKEEEKKKSKEEKRAKYEAACKVAEKEKARQAEEKKKRRQEEWERRQERERKQKEKKERQKREREERERKAREEKEARLAKEREERAEKERIERERREKEKEEKARREREKKLAKEKEEREAKEKEEREAKEKREREAKEKEEQEAKEKENQAAQQRAAQANGIGKQANRQNAVASLSSSSTGVKQGGSSNAMQRSSNNSVGNSANGIGQKKANNKPQLSISSGPSDQGPHPPPLSQPFQHRHPLPHMDSQPGGRIPPILPPHLPPQAQNSMIFVQGQGGPMVVPTALSHCIPNIGPIPNYSFNNPNLPSHGPGGPLQQSGMPHGFPGAPGFDPSFNRGPPLGVNLSPYNILNSAPAAPSPFGGAFPSSPWRIGSGTIGANSPWGPLGTPASASPVSGFGAPGPHPGPGGSNGTLPPTPIQPPPPFLQQQQLYVGAGSRGGGLGGSTQPPPPLGGSSMWGPVPPTSATPNWVQSPPPPGSATGFFSPHHSFGVAWHNADTSSDNQSAS